MNAPGPTVEVDDRRPPADRLADPDGLAGDLAALMSAVLGAEGVGDEAEAGLHLVDADEIAGLAAEHLGNHGPTDVLSFPVDGGPGPGGAGAGGTDGEHVEALGWLVGDVVLCPSVAAAQAASHAGSLVDECRLLVVHGSLHLCGWDHDTDEHRAAMWAREREVMAGLGVSPSLDPWGHS